jgi:hypothetical protein
MYKYTDHARKIMVGWTYDVNDILVLTVYEIKRRWREE